MTEPDVTLTDYALALEGILFFVLSIYCIPGAEVHGEECQESTGAYSHKGLKWNTIFAVCLGEPAFQFLTICALPRKGSCCGPE